MIKAADNPSAMQVSSEKAAWQWIFDHNPSFTLTTILPAVNFGRSVSGDWKATALWPKMAMEGDFAFIRYVPSQYFVDVVDTAKLYLGAVLHPELQRERIFGVSQLYTWNGVRRVLPSKALGDDISEENMAYPGIERGDFTEPRARSEWLLKEMGQEDGYTSLKKSLVECFTKAGGEVQGGLGAS